jgi:hypothetical protein
MRVAGQTGSGYTPMYRVIVAVGWASRFCATDCVYVTSSLFSSKTQEPVFSIRDSIGRVKISSTPTAQTGTVTGPVTPCPSPLTGRRSPGGRPGCRSACPSVPPTA